MSVVSALKERWHVIAAVIFLGVAGWIVYTRYLHSPKLAVQTMGSASASPSVGGRPPPPIEVSLAPLPKGVPLIGPDGVDSDGYPLAYVDRPALRSLFWHRRFEELTKQFVALQDAFEANPRKEYLVADAADAFNVPDRMLTTGLDAWVAATPKEFAPYLARAAHWLAIAWMRRGGPKGQKKDLPGVASALKKVDADLQTVFTLRPKLIAGMRIKIERLALSDNHGDMTAVVEAAFASCPECLQIRTSYLVLSTPKWGGSYTDMNAFAEKGKPFKNPRFRVLAGFADWDKAVVAVGADDLKAAGAAIDRALGFGEYYSFLKERAYIRQRMGEGEGALTDLNRALVLRPGYPDLLLTRADTLAASSKWEDAGRDLLLSLRVINSEHGHKIFPKIVGALEHDGWEAHKAGKNDDALRLIDIATNLAPTNGKLLSRRAALVLGVDKIDAPTLEAGVKAHPDDMHLRLAYAHVLAQSGSIDRAVQTLTEGITLHADEGRLYMERANAYEALNKKTESDADIVKACELGITEACELRG